MVCGFERDNKGCNLTGLYFLFVLLGSNVDKKMYVFFAILFDLCDQNVCASLAGCIRVIASLPICLHYENKLTKNIGSTDI